MNPLCFRKGVRPSLVLACLLGTSPVTWAQDAPVAAPPLAPIEQLQVAPAPLAPLPATAPRLRARVLVVDDLTPRPVPFTAFQVISLADGSVTAARTGEDGRFELELAPGLYRLESVTPLKFKGKTYQWARPFEMKAGEPTTLELTGDDATMRDDVPQTARQIADEAKIYRALREGVATVEGERGSGTAFLFDARGLMLTNSHVVEGSRALVVRFAPGLRVAARVIASDPAKDVAILSVNPDITTKLPVVPLWRSTPEPGQTAPAVAVEGEKVMAIGSPLGEEKVLTTGLISRVKEGVLISDININPGNSGGPLLNMAGEAIGITSFNESAQSGPGLSGIIALSQVLPLADEARARWDAATPELRAQIAPSARLLPDFSPIAVPAQALDTAAKSEIEIPLIKAPSAFETRFLTPFSLTSTQFKAERELAKKREKRRSKQSDKGANEAAEQPQHRFYDATRAGVAIAISPKLVESKASKKRGLLGALVGGMVGVIPRTKVSMEFRHDFYDMELLRNGQIMEPVQRKRVPMSVYWENLYLNFEAKDTAFAGIYTYDPAVFAPGGTLVLRVRREFNIEKWDEVKIPDALRAGLYAQFAPHRAALQQSAAQETTQALSLSTQ